MANEASVDIKLDTRALDRLVGAIPARAGMILDQGATEIQAAAIVNTKRVDTGAMKNGWRVESTEQFKRVIFNTQDYAIYHEMGTVHIPAMPMLVPAVEMYRQKIETAWQALFVE